MTARFVLDESSWAGSDRGGAGECFRMPSSACSKGLTQPATEAKVVVRHTGYYLQRTSAAPCSSSRYCSTRVVACNSIMISLSGSS